MSGLLILGFLLGMRHALEADHVAAVASLATGARSVSETVRQGAAWGVGHTLTLFLFGSVVLLLDTVMPERLAGALEAAVGVMLVALGTDVLWRLRRRMHFQLPCQADGARHLHAHSHAGDPQPRDPAHRGHGRPAGFPLRALLVGLMHGMAGSAALIMLTLQTVSSPLTGMGYMALFGIGSVAGMAALSLVIAIPLRHSARGLTGLHTSLQAVVGVATIGLGLHITFRLAGSLF